METVLSCTKVRDWINKEGKPVPIYSVALSDGQGGESFGKEIPTGTPMSELTITPNPPYGNKVTWNKPGSGGSGFSARQRAGNESFALSYAKDLGVAYVNKGNNIEPEKVIAWAEKFYDWLEKKKAGTKPEDKSSLPF